MSASLTVRVLNADSDPVEGREVFLRFVRSFLSVASTHRTVDTDEEGAARFDAVPVGLAEVFVDGDRHTIVVVKDADHKEVTITL